MNTDDTILTGDCFAVLPTLPAGSVDLVYFDPPFNIGWDYDGGYDDDLPEDVYFARLENVFRAILRVLSPSGSLWVQCGQTIQAEVGVLLKKLGLHRRNSIVWHFEFGEHQKRKFAPSWQMLYWFTVHPADFTFNADDLRVPSKRQEMGDKRANPRGRIPSDVWDISRVCGTFGERIKGHSCQTPLLACELAILACSKPGDLVLDPMCGTGSTLAAAKQQGRRFLGIELREKTANLARERLASTEVGFVF